ncbi:MAG: hypothetical protein DRP11_03335 [Candidatus Aenigmatarchaeota archaeon]|nr:MAG: hypothetical protein DRP11_03335 [Candidatus Aenigmarchaeota archaeon]
MAPAFPFMVLAFLGILGTLWNPKFILITILSLTVLVLGEEFPEEKPLQTIKRIIMNEKDPYFDSPMYRLTHTRSRIDSFRAKLERMEKKFLLYKLSK